VPPREADAAIRRREATSGDPDLRLSVVIPTRDREEDLARCLASFADQSRTPVQVVVVDNASRGDGARRAALAAGAIYLREDRRGLDFARNAGVRVALGDIVAFCDDDVVLHRNWCREMLAAFFDPSVEAVTGLVLPLELATPAQRIFEIKWSFGRGFERIDYTPAFFERTKSKGCPAWLVGAGASMAFRREVFMRVGLFDERLDAGAAGCSGDSEMWYRVLATGGTCRYEPRIVSFHRHRQSLHALRRQIKAYMRGHVMALLVQYQRYGHWGNLRRALLVMPRAYLRRLLRRLRHGRMEDDMLYEEVGGYFSGFFYFAFHRRLETRYPAYSASTHASVDDEAHSGTSPAQASID
jgi:glycosyltransferase involved in cell wall biosynthesis